jgi:hypothetical protein
MLNLAYARNNIRIKNKKKINKLVLPNKFTINYPTAKLSGYQEDFPLDTLYSASRGEFNPQLD